MLEHLGEIQELSRNELYRLRDMVLRDQGRKRSRTGARRGNSSRIPFQAKRGIAGRQEGGKAGRQQNCKAI